MHICLPDTREVKPQHGSAYLIYNVHINGLYHCSLRFKQLLHLHQTLARNLPSPGHQLPSFPPKRLLPLTGSQVEERRQQLEKYLQNISQDKAISNSSIFNLFLLEAQRESTRIRDSQVHLDIELVNGQKIKLQIVTHDSADAVLTKVCRALGLDDRYHAYFCLCLCGYDVIRDKLIIKRRLSFFEAPYVTLQMAIQQQEQLQNILTHFNSNSTIATPIINNNNNNNNNSCCCQSCLQHYQQQLLTNSTTTLPLIGSSSGGCVNNNHCHYNCNNNNNNTNQDGNNNQFHNQNFYNSNHHGSCRQSTSSNSPLFQASSTSTFVTHRILLRKSYWDPIYDTYILNDQQALNLLFIQTVYDIKHSLMFVDKETYHQLESLLASDSKMDYILLARTLKYYNYVHFEPCYSDYPRPRTKVMISIGSKELNMRVLKSPKTFVPSTSPSSSASSQQQHQQLSQTSSLPQANQATSSQQQQQQITTTINNNTKRNNNNNQAIRHHNHHHHLNNHHQQHHHNHHQQQSSSPFSPTSNQQVSVPSEQQVLYCTSSLVPSGYQHLITKEDLVEEEYNFKVPLIRCWRLTSLETLNSNNTQPSAQAPKSLSLFGSSSNNENKPATDCNHQRTIFNSGNGGISLMAALTGNRGTGSSSRTTTTISNSNHQHCQHENHRCSFGPAIDQSQFSQYELSFEYLVSKDTLRWITISSDQAIFISISLQGVVDELVSKRDIKTCNYKGTSDAPNVLPAAVVSSSTTTSNNTNNTNVANKNSINAPSNGPASSNNTNNSQKSSSFTYMFRDGSQKLMNTSNQQLIDKFGTTLGYSPSNPYALALARQRQQVRAAAANGSTTGGGLLFLSNGSRFTAALSGFSSTSSSPPEIQYHQIYNCSSNNNNLQYQQQQQHALEISNLKKAPSPIINDAFEGVTNEDDL